MLRAWDVPPAVGNMGQGSSFLTHQAFWAGQAVAAGSEVCQPGRRQRPSGQPGGVESDAGHSGQRGRGDEPHGACLTQSAHHAAHQRVQAHPGEAPAGRGR